MASVPGYMYAQKGQELFVNLYAAGTADVTLQDGLKIKITQDTRYPWDGVVRLKVNVVRHNARPTMPGDETLRQNTARFAMNLRVPGWARNEVVPGDLYRFLDPVKEAATVRINSQPYPTAEVLRMAHPLPGPGSVSDRLLPSGLQLEGRRCR